MPYTPTVWHSGDVVTSKKLNKLEQGVADATSEEIIDSWLEENISQETGYALDRTLTLENAAAPADLVGDLKSAFNASEKIDNSVISESEHTALVATAGSYNYSVANGGYFGTFDTYNLESSYYHKIDNVLVKGNIKIKNVIVPDVYAELSSDHYPFIADLEMLV